MPYIAHFQQILHRQTMAARQFVSQGTKLFVLETNGQITAEAAEHCSLGMLRHGHFEHRLHMGSPNHPTWVIYSCMVFQHVTICYNMLTHTQQPKFSNSIGSSQAEPAGVVRWRGWNPAESEEVDVSTSVSTDVSQHSQIAVLILISLDIPHFFQNISSVPHPSLPSPPDCSVQHFDLRGAIRRGCTTRGLANSGHKNLGESNGIQ